MAVLLIGLVKGWAGGLFRQLASTVGLAAGLVVAFMLYSSVGERLTPIVGGDVAFGRGLAFVLIWLGFPVALSLLAFMLTKAMETVKLGGLNRLCGALLGGLKYLLYLSCVLNVAFWLRLVPDSLAGQSRLYVPVRSVAAKVFEVCKPHIVRAAERVVLEDSGGWIECEYACEGRAFFNNMKGG